MHQLGDDDYSFESKLSSNLNLEKEYDYGYEDDDKKKKILIIVAVIIVIIMVIFAIYKIFFETKEEEVVQESEPVAELEMEESINGYQILGKIVIDDINVEQYILNSVEDEALDSGVGKLYGSSLNNYGNFCIAGHNKENVFEKLTELEVGDEFTIIDRKLNETIYKITEIYTVEPDDLKCLMQDENKIEITLITCENEATQRLVVKAEEKLDNEDTTDENVINTISDAEENV